MTRQFFSIIAAMTVALFSAGAAFANDPVHTSRSSDLAVGGYDTVSFFSGAPQTGSSDFETSYRGATWRFTSQANLDRFLANPDQYAPQYGGYCAWAVSQGYTAPGNPRYWKVVDGKLYLNFNGKVQRDWEKDIPGFIAKANANWPSVLN